MHFLIVLIAVVALESSGQLAFIQRDLLVAKMVCSALADFCTEPKFDVQDAALCVGARRLQCNW